MKNKRAVKILFAMLAMLFFVLVSKSFNSVDAAETASFGPPFAHSYIMSGDWVAYCREHGKALGGNVGGLRINQLQYTKTSGNQHIEPATGYALYCGATGESLQHVIWYSKLWTGGENAVVDADSRVAGIDQRFKQYGDVYYGIIKQFKNLNGTNKNLFSITSDTKEENIKVMVNQQNKKYIVGPYKIELNPNIQSYNVESSSITDPINEAKNALSEELQKDENDINKQAIVSQVSPVERASSIAFGDVYVNTKNAYYNGTTYKAPTSLEIDGKTVSQIDNIAAHSKSIYDSDKDVMDKAESELQQAQENLNNLTEKANEANAQQIYDEKKEAYDNVKSVYDKTEATYDKIKDISNLGIAMQEVFNKYTSTNGKGLDASELEADLRQYYSKNGVDLENEDSKFNFSTDDVRNLLQSLTETLNNTSKHISATFENNVITIKNNSSESAKETNYYKGLADSLYDNDTDENYMDINNGTFNISQEAIQELYNELINCKNVSKPFATFDITKDLQGINGDPNSYKFLDSNGNEIQFPDFVNKKEFYIEFTPNNDGNIEYIGLPNLKIHWLDDFSYDVNGAWTAQTVVSVAGVPTEYTELSHTQQDYSTGAPIFYKEQKVQVPVHVGKSGVIGGYATGTLYYSSTSCVEDTKTVGGGVDSNGNKIPTRKVHLGWKRTGDNWILDTNKSTQSWELNSVSNKFQRLNGEIKVTGNSGTPEGTGKWSEVDSNIGINKSCNIQIGGTVWIESPEQKTGDIDGKIGNGDVPFAGIQVQLYDVTQGTTAVIGGNGNQGKLVAITTTDKNGHYRFFGTNDTINGSYTDALGQKHSMRELLLNPLHKYYVTFVYNGQLYQPTYYYKQLTSPGYSNAKDMSREEFNAKFKRIDSDTANYKSSGTNSWNRAYSAKHKLKNNDGSYISFNNSALTYEDAWRQFLSYATNSRDYTLSPKNSDASYVWGTKGNTIVWQSQYTGGGNYQAILSTLDNSNYNVALEKLKGWLSGLGVGQNEQNNIVTFIEDSMMVATTLQENKTYPFDTNKFENYCIANIEKPENKTVSIGKAGSYKYLYSLDSDQSRWVDFGLNQREVADLALAKDLYRVTMLVNGKKETYDYNKKNLNDDGVWEIHTRASDSLFNGTDYYNRPVRSSEYLLDQSDSYGGADIKNLQVWVTYKIVIKNQGAVDIDLNNTEIVDYYDASQYTFDGDLNGNTYTPKRYNQNNFDINSYVGKDGNGTILSDNALKVSTEASGQARNPSHEEIKGGNYDYNTLYLTGLRSSTSGSATLGVGQYSYVYITFKVINDPNTGRIMLDQNLDNGALTIGKRNIAEINAYSTKYTSDQSIPDNLDGKTRISVSGKIAGLIDTDSNPGSLSSKDLYNDGNIIIDANNEVNNRLEDDTDKAPNLKITIDTNKDNVRKFKGMVYEDNRTENANKSKIGNGTYEKNDETTINGVTMQLVELVQDVDKNGFATGTYLGEKVWASYNYNNLKDEPTRNYDRYYSGTNSSKVILSGPGILKVNANGLPELQGQYEFDSIPAGDFYIRFVYGDTTQTTLTTDENNEVNKLVGNSVDGLTGLNKKSYNGQDYKSTVYQSDININQNTSYNGIKGFTNADLQNYAKIDDVDKVENGNVQMAVHDKDSDFATQRYGIPGKDKMYYYDIGESDKNSSISDAKDVYDYRDIANNYSSNNDVDDNGAASSKDSKNGVLNNKAEILSSFEKLGTYQKGDLKARQSEMIRNFMNNTRMVAQTGIINTEIERNTQNLNNITKNENAYSNTQDYTIDNIDLGLVERPRAQLKLNKQVTNFKIVLANQQVLYNTNKAVNNLVYSKHSGHKVNYEDLRLKSVAVSANNTKESPELITAYMDDELLEGSKMQVEYTLTVTNVGEVDYLDKNYYYTGQTNNSSEGNMSKTNAVNVIDYHSNSSKFDENDNKQWNVKTANELVSSVPQQGNNETTGANAEITINNEKVPNDVVNRKYINELRTYDTLLVTGDLAKGTGSNSGLLPEISKSGDDNSSKSTKLNLSSELSSDTAGGNLIYNNLVEIVATTNSQGRRMQFSIVGNQEMGDQSLGNNAAADANSGEDLITPSEIDADSAQKIVIMPPTGENKNYIPIVVGSIIGAIAIIGAIVLIRKYVKKQ